MSSRTIAGRLHEIATTAPDTVFVISAHSDEPRSHTYGEIDARVDRAAAQLADLGIGADSAVHLQLANSVEFVVAVFAVNRLGGVIVPTSPASTLDDIAYIASHAECAVSIVDARRADVIQAASEMAPEIRHVLTVGGDVEGLGRFEDWSGAMLSELVRPRAAADLAAVLYTSGTTGWPKGVMLTDANLQMSGEMTADLLRVRPDDRWLITLPLFHLNALGYSLMSALSTGASVALTDGFDPVSWSSLAAATGATLSSLFAVHARQLLAAPQRDVDADNRLRVFVFAQHLTAAERWAIGERFGTTPVQIYGMTETIGPTIADPLYAEEHSDTIGRALPWATVKVVDRAGRAVADGTNGELMVHGEPGRTLMAGYFRRPEETQLVMRNGWLRTGDNMVRDADGSFHFLGRAVEVIKPGVDNVSAPEIERVLVEHVSVLEASVVGVHNDAGDEVIVAFIALQPDDDATPDEVLEWARERLADYKVPARVIVVDELPRNAVGKVQRRELQQRAATALAASG